MSKLNERLDALRQLIESQDFLKGKGLSNEVNIRMFCYDPKEEMAVRHFTERLTKDAGRGCRGIELGAVGGDESLVTGDDAGAGGEGRQNEGAGGFDPTDELDDEVVSRGHRGGVDREQLTGDDRVAGRVEVAHGDAGDLQACAGARGEVIGLLQEETHDLGADGAGTEDADREGAGGGGLLGAGGHVEPPWDVVGGEGVRRDARELSDTA